MLSGWILSWISEIFLEVWSTKMQGAYGKCLNSPHFMSENFLGSKMYLEEESACCH